jgi:hypothetical protein
MMNRGTGSLVTAILAIAAMPGAAQWLNVPAKGIPRTKDGKPDMSAPAPRKPDGKPDLSGIWRPADSQNRILGDISSDFKLGEFPIQPWAEALTNERMNGSLASESPPAHCLPLGIAIADHTFSPFKIIQESDLVVILHEAQGDFRQIFLDGRTLPKDPNPTWMGYSVGRWDGDILVVDSAGFNGKVWLDAVGHPATEALHVTERFRRRDFGRLEVAGRRADRVRLQRKRKGCEAHRGPVAHLGGDDDSKNWFTRGRDLGNRNLARRRAMAEHPHQRHPARQRR